MSLSRAAFTLAVNWIPKNRQTSARCFNTWLHLYGALLVNNTLFGLKLACHFFFFREDLRWFGPSTCRLGRPFGTGLYILMRQCGQDKEEEKHDCAGNGDCDIDQVHGKLFNFACEIQWIGYLQEFANLVPLAKSGKKPLRFCHSRMGHCAYMVQ